MKVVNDIKSQYSRILGQDDWEKFKEVAEYYLKQAACLKKKDIKNRTMKLLLRNSQKRLFLGIGCELLLKAYYLKKGYCINRFTNKFEGKKTPTHQLSSLKSDEINEKDTFTLDPLINNLSKICKFKESTIINRGLKIAMVFRNKEGHVTFPSHNFDEKNYRDIENSIMAIYDEAFGEKLIFKISMQPYEKPAFKKHT